jgi:tektin-2
MSDYEGAFVFLVYESVRLRESIFHTIGQSSSDLESQGKASEYALRKRLHELERSLKELEWQKKQVKSIYEKF